MAEARFQHIRLAAKAGINLALTAGDNDVDAPFLDQPPRCLRLRRGIDAIGIDLAACVAGIGRSDDCVGRAIEDLRAIGEFGENRQGCSPEAVRPGQLGNEQRRIAGRLLAGLRALPLDTAAHPRAKHHDWDGQARHGDAPGESRVSRSGDHPGQEIREHDGHKHLGVWRKP